MENTNESSFTFSYPQDSGFKKTDIHFYAGKPDLKELFLNEGSQVSRLFITDTNIASLECMKDFIASFTGGEAVLQDRAYDSGNSALLVLGSGEKYKTIENVLLIAKTAVDRNFNRNSIFIGIGGGVICDMTGFAASIFKRGIECRFVPTTLLADVDAAVGGKTGCDFESYKNMIGAFNPATELFVWSSFTRTLSEREYFSGLAEAVKTAFLFSREMCSLFKNDSDKIRNRDDEIIFRMIRECATAKARIVEKDFKEKGERAFLNLGHTFGHALEAVAGLGEVTHGEAVAWGMARAADLSLLLGLCTSSYAEDVKAVLSSYGYETGPVHSSLKNVSGGAEKLISAMHKDKKNSSSAVKFVLQKDFCQTVIQEVPDEKIAAVLAG